MLADLVLDTNVLAHADNDREQRQKYSRQLIELLKKRKTILCVDEGYNNDPAKNKSQIFSEYFAHLVPGGLAFSILTHLASSQRVRALPKKVAPHVGKKIRTLIHDSSDRIFIKVALNSIERFLTTHDFKNFPAKATKDLKSNFKMSVADAQTTCPLL